MEHLGSFQVIELRRYIIKPGERENFAHYFESYFPEAFEPKQENGLHQLQFWTD